MLPFCISLAAFCKLHCGTLGLSCGWVYFDMITHHCKMGTFLPTDYIEASDGYGIKTLVDSKLDPGHPSM